MVHIEHRLLYVAHLMAQQVDRHHGKGMTVAALRYDVLRILILHTKVLAETQCLRLKPGLLQFYQDEVLATVRLAHRGTKVDAEHRQRLTLVVGILVRTHLHFCDVLLQ